MDASSVAWFRTPGKKALGIKVVHDDGSELTWQSSFIRNLLRAADFLPFYYGFGLITMMSNRDFKRLGDISAGTIVIYTEKSGRKKTIPEAKPLTPSFVLYPAEQRSLVQFAERVNELNPERAMELANVLEPLPGRKDKNAVDTLLGYANWMMGRRG